VQCHAVSQATSTKSLSSGSYRCSNCHTPGHPPLDNNCVKCHQLVAWKR
jgi:hypothetical protein